VLVGAQHAQCRDVQQESGRCSDVEAHPRDGDGAEDVAVRECKHAARAALGQGDEIKGSRVDLRGSLAPRASVLVDLPSRPRALDGLGGYAFVVAVVDLTQKQS
jgi:hypothetical protein